jgi:hypothetical protein
MRLGSAQASSRCATSAHAKSLLMQSQVDYGSCVVVSAALGCRGKLHTSERAVSGYQYLTGSNSGKWCYQRLRFIINLLAPVR